MHSIDPLAFFGARFAYSGAHPRHLLMELALMQHEVGGSRADRGAVDHHAEVLRRGVLATHLQAMRHCRA
jgi:hypothetical protein